MIVRSAVLEGSVAEEDRAAFDQQLSDTVLRAVARYPKVREVRLRRRVETEDGAPPVYAIFDLFFDSLEDMHAALASETRQDVRKTIVSVMQVFRGRIYHFIMDDSAICRGADEADRQS